MKWIERLNIAGRIGVGFGILLLIATLMVGLALAGLQRTGAAVDRILHNEWVKADAASTIDSLTRANARRTMELFFADAGRATAVRQHIADNRKGIDEALATLDRLVALPEGKTRLAELKQARMQYVAAFSEVDRLLKSDQREAAQAQLLNQTLPALDTLQQHVEGFADFQTKLAKQSGAAAEADIRQALIGLTGLGLGMLVVAGGLGCGWRVPSPAPSNRPWPWPNGWPSVNWATAWPPPRAANPAA